MKLTQNQAVGGAVTVGALIIGATGLFDNELYRLIFVSVLVVVNGTVTLVAHKSPPKQ